VSATNKFKYSNKKIITFLLFITYYVLNYKEKDKIYMESNFEICKSFKNIFIYGEASH